MRQIQIGGYIIPKEEKGPFVNVAFTLDMESVELLQLNGKNKSKTVRRAIKHYCRDVKPSPELLENFRRVCIERSELEEIVQLQKNEIARLLAYAPAAAKAPGIFSRILKRCRNLLYKHRE